MTTTVSSKRQITLPSRLCRELEIEPGQKLDAQKLGPVILLSKAEMNFAEFKELVAAASDREPLPMGVNEYIRRIRDGGDLSETYL